MEGNHLEILGTMVYGIYVMTTHHEEEVNGMIASWVSQVSFDPPLVMAAVHPNRRSHGLIERSGSFALHLLSREQIDLINRFKGPDPAAKFASLHWSKGKTGCPILKDCLGYLDCAVRAEYRPGNHTLFVGEVMESRVFSHDVPLGTFNCEGFYIGID